MDWQVRDEIEAEWPCNVWFVSDHGNWHLMDLDQF